MFYYFRFWIALAVVLIIIMSLTACGGGGSDIYDESSPSFNGPPNMPTYRSPFVVYSSPIYYQ